MEMLAPVCLEALYWGISELGYYNLLIVAAAGSPNGNRACVINTAEQR